MAADKCARKASVALTYSSAVSREILCLREVVKPCGTSFSLFALISHSPPGTLSQKTYFPPFNGTKLNNDSRKRKKEIHMRYRLLGNSGLRVSEAALGTMTFGDDWGWGAA